MRNRIMRLAIVAASAIAALTFDIQAQIIRMMDYSNYSSAPIGVHQSISIREGGFSGLTYIPGTNGKEFWVVSYRGCNIDAANANLSACRPQYDKMYSFPSYGPKIFRLRLNGDSAQIIRTIPIRRPDGTPATGLLLPTGLGSLATEIAMRDTVMDCANYASKVVGKDAWGIDSEGILVDLDGNFWVCEEGGPSVWKISPDGIVLQRYTPWARVAGAQPQDLPIDTVFGYRKNNRGFEGMCLSPSGRIYVAIQSPLLYPNKTIGEGTRVHRILEINPATGATRMFAYLNDGIIGASGSNQIRLRDWKLGDMVAVNDSTFLVLEAALRGTSDVRRMYMININGATPVHSGLYNGVTLEALVDSAGLAANGIVPVRKTLFMDLLANQWPAVYEKAEGLTIIDDSTIAIGNDNDYGVVSPAENGVATATGITCHVLTYRLQGANKIPNYRPLPYRVNLTTGPTSTQGPFLTPVASGVRLTSIITVPDTTSAGYQAAGIMDGTGAYDNNDGTFTMLVGHEIVAGLGAVRAHGQNGAFISRWVIDKSS
ncbi:MAG: esterase-like activity of phytase family protein, partial [Candidatus Kapaibacterium sp.]